MFKRCCKRFPPARIMSLEEAVADIPDAAKVLVGGFGVTGQPHMLCKQLMLHNKKNLHFVCESVGAPGFGLGQLFENNQVKRVTCSFLGRNDVVKKMYITGKVEIEFIPQGTLIEKIRAGGAGIPAFYAPAGAGTWYEEHGCPIKYMPDGIHVDIMSDKKEVRQWDGRWCCLETAIKGDFSLVKCWKADTAGNLIFKDNTVNYNKAVATAGKVTIAEVEEIVEAGELDPNAIVVPGLYVDRIVKVPKYKTLIEPGCLNLHAHKTEKPDPAKFSTREKICRRAALELQPGMFVNLGVGMPCQAGDYCTDIEKVTLHGENGMLGIGPFPDTEEEASGDNINAARMPVKSLPHTSYFSSEEAFAQIRGGHLDLAMLGALEVGSNGDLASWLRPGQPTTGMGGAMELVTNSCRVIVTMAHTTKDGKPKIFQECNLPLTGKRCVDRIITDKAVFDIDKTQHRPMTLVELAPDATVEEIRQTVDAPFTVSPDLKPIEYSMM